MPTEDRARKYAPVILRFGLAGLFLWFGISQVLAPDQWTSWVPLWVPDFLHLDARYIVLLNGGFEIIGGILLLLGVFVRWVALLLGLHLMVIAYEIGYNDIGIRDAALAVSCFAVSLFGNDSWSLQRKPS
jgi:uncharacterized membrane protein YphA (DoxX/SURF4 family)